MQSGIMRFRPRRAALILVVLALAIAITITGFAALLTTPAPVQAEETTLWEGTLTVGKQGDADRWGYLAGTFGEISNNSFTIGGTTYNVQRLLDNREHNKLDVRLAPNISNALKQILVLTVGGETFNFSSSSLVSNSLSWPMTSQGWIVGTEVAVSLKATVPGAPTSFSASAGPAKVALAWANPNDTTITKYQYRQKEGSGAFGNWKNISGSDASTTSYDVTGLTVGTAYTFQVRAVNAAAPAPRPTP